MRKIINLTNNPKAFMEKVLITFRENADIFRLSRGEEKYSIKFKFPSGTSIVDVIVAPDCYRFHVSQEGSALLNQQTFKPFDTGISIHNNKIKYHQLPSNRDAQEWLKARMNSNQNFTNGESLIMMATVCEIIWSLFLPCMKVREYGDTIEYAPRDDFMTFIDDFVKAYRKKYKDEHRLDGWDVVTLTDKQLAKLGGTLEEHQVKHDFDNIPLHRFCLALYKTEGKYTEYFFVNDHNNVLHFEIETSDTSTTAYCDISYEKTQSGELSLQLSEDTNAMTWLTTTSTTEGMEEITHWQWMVDMFFSINSFMLHFGDVTMEVETKVAKEQTGNRAQRRKNKTNSVRLFKTYKLIKNWKSKARKKAEITCPAWGVRGHFRHYRNGKVVFIESYVKGPDKEKYKGKEYALLPYKDA